MTTEKRRGRERDRESEHASRAPFKGVEAARFFGAKLLVGGGNFKGTYSCGSIRYSVFYRAYAR